MKQMDDNIGYVLKKLDAMGQTNNTIVVFTTDNGAEAISFRDGGVTPFRGQNLVRTGHFRPRKNRARQYIIAGTGEFHMEDGKHVIGPGSVFAIPANVRHDLANTGTTTLRAVAFLAAAMFTQTFDEVMLPPKTHVLGAPNREG